MTSGETRDPTPRVELPDVNVLFALTIASHEHHEIAETWADHTPRFATTPITELGLIRSLMNPAIPGGRLTAFESIAVIETIRDRAEHEFWPDDQSATCLEVWQRHMIGHRQVTDLYLLALAQARRGTLVTLDVGLAASLPPSAHANLLTLH